MSAENREKRLRRIRKQLKRGDVKRISEMAGVSSVWISYVLSNRGTSERILLLAEQLIDERQQK